MPQTTTWALPYPSLSDAPNVPLDLQRLATAAEAALNQHSRLYPGTSEEDISLTTGTKTLVNWTFAIPSSWQAAHVLFHWSGRQWSDAGVHVRTSYRVNLNGSQFGPTIQQSGYVPSGSACAQMVEAARTFGDLGAGTQRITVTGDINVGANNQSSLGAQAWFVLLFRTK